MRDRKESDVLAIVAPDLFHASQTFFDDHIENIAPGRTVVVHLSSTGQKARNGLEALEVPLRKPLRVPNVPVIGRLVKQYNLYVQGILTKGQRRELIHFLEANGVTHVFSEFLSTAATVASALKGRDYCLSAMSHGWDVNVLGQQLFWRLRYKLLHHSTRLITNGEILKAMMVGIGFPRDAIQVVPCAVRSRPDISVDRPSTPTRVVMVSRLIDWKGPLESLRSFAAAARERPGLELHIVGDGPLRSRLVAEIGRLGLAASVTMHGAIAHEATLKVIAESDILIQHCLTLPGQSFETQGLSVLEAMSMGLAVVVTDHGAFPSYITDGETGWLVPENDVAAMASRIVALADNPRLRMEVGRRAQRLVALRYAPHVVYPALRRAIGL